MLRSGLGVSVFMLAMMFVSNLAHGADCLAYLTADAAYEKVKIPFDRAKEGYERIAKGIADEAYRRAANAAKAKESKTRKDAEKVRKEAHAAANERFEKIRNAAHKTYDNSLPADICRSVPSPGSRTLCNPIGKGRHIEKTASRKYDAVVRQADSVKRRAIRTADRAYESAARAARELRRQEERQAKAATKSLPNLQDPSLKKAHETLEAARKALQAARKTRDDAYITAYANPDPGPYRRKVRRYDRAMVLKVAYHERKWCLR